VLTSEDTLTIPSPDRRVVQEVTQGPYAGIFRIIGRVSDMVADSVSPNQGTVLPAFVDRAHLLDHFGPMELVKLKPRYVLYRETAPVATAEHVNTFHPGQR
jgi:hypothetical protein